VVGCAETNNSLQDNGYNNVNVVREITVPDIGLLETIENIAPERQPADCMLSACVRLRAAAWHMLTCCMQFSMH
jgi:hypothetical protein